MDFKLVIHSFILSVIHKTYMYSRSADYSEQICGQILLEVLIICSERMVSPNLLPM